MNAANATHTVDERGLASVYRRLYLAGKRAEQAARKAQEQESEEEEQSDA